VVGDHNAHGVKHVESHHRIGSRGTDGKRNSPSEGKFRVFVKGIELVLPNPDDLIIDNSDPHQIVVTGARDDYTTVVQDSNRAREGRGRGMIRRALVLKKRVRVYSVASVFTAGGH
jgi:hypothetical protein